MGRPNPLLKLSTHNFCEGHIVLCGFTQEFAESAFTFHSECFPTQICMNMKKCGPKKGTKDKALGFWVCDLQVSKTTRIIY